MTGTRNSCKSLTRRKVLKYGLWTGLSTALPTGFWTVGCSKGAQEKRPNIFLITVDTLRADHLGCYGYQRNTSPGIDAFAQDAVVFENCLSHAPDTRLSFASMMSGFLPHETGITRYLNLPSEVNTLPSILQRQGYKTLAVIGNYVLRRGQGWEKGFDIFDDTMNERERVRRWPERRAWPTSDRAIELLKEFQEAQLFMWIHYQDPHGPYTPPVGFANLFQDSGQQPQDLRVNTSLSGRGGIPAHQRLGGRRDLHYYISQYDGEIRYVDTHINRFLYALKELNLYDDAVIIFSSDHGEGMGEHAYYFAHGENLYWNQLHVPLIMRYDEKLKGRRADFVQHIDILPTILRLAGMESDSRLRGCDLREQRGTERAIFSEMKSPLVEDSLKFSIVMNGYKLIYTPLFHQYELFDIEGDRHEEHNLIDKPKYHNQSERLKTRLDHLIKEDLLKIGQIEKPKELSEEEIKNLKSLGYVR